MSNAEVKQCPGPDGHTIYPLNVNMKQQDEMGLKNGKEITDIVPYKVFSKEEILDALNKQGFLSAWYNVRSVFDTYEGDMVLLVSDPDNAYGGDLCNFWIPAMEESAKALLKKFEEDEKQGDQGTAVEVKDMLIKYIAVVRISSEKREKGGGESEKNEKKIDTIARFDTDLKPDQHKAFTEAIVQNPEIDLLGTKPMRFTTSEYCDYMAWGVPMDESYELESQLIVVAGYGKLFSKLAEPELALSAINMFKLRSGITPEMVENAIYSEFNSRLKPLFMQIAEQFEDEADNPNEVIPEYEQKPLVAQREWKELTLEDVEKIDRDAQNEAASAADAKPKEDTGKVQRSKWVFDIVNVDEARVKNSRPLREFYLAKPRKDFGWDIAFEDVEDDTVASFPRLEEKTANFTIQKMDYDIGFQCAVPTADTSSQTEWARKINKTHQVVPRRFTEEEKEQLKDSKEMQDFLDSKANIILRFLETNYTLDLFNDEFECMKEVESAVGKGVDVNLKSKNQLRRSDMPPRRICGICWHPTVKGMVAYACGSNLDAVKSVELSGRVMWTSIILWSLSNLLEPRLRLTVPGDITCFKINEENPYIIVGGLRTGQVIMWDLSSATINGQDVYAPQNAGNATNKSSTVPSFSHKVTSVLNYSHSRAVMDLQWLPKGASLTRQGKYEYDPDATWTRFFATASDDGYMCFWDVKLKEVHNPDGSVDKNLRWGPIFKIPLVAPGAKLPLTVSKFALLKSEESKTQFALVSQCGEVSFGMWAAEPDEDSGKTGAFDVINSNKKAHTQFCVAVQQSPHFPEIIMVIGDWTFSLWKEGCDEPLFRSPPAEAYLTCGGWSPTRPGVIITGRSDGVLDIWVLIDQIHKPMLHKTVRANTEISSISFWKGNLQQQLLAVGDFTGTLHVFEVPRLLQRAPVGEKRTMKKWYAHEIKRLEYVRKSANKTPEVKQEASAAAKESKEKKQKEKQSVEEMRQAKEKEYQELLEQFREQFFPVE